MELSISDFGGIDTYSNPFNVKDGNIIHCVNLISNTDGSRSKRIGYSTYLGTPDTSQVNSLFSWMRDDGTTLFTYRTSGSTVYYSLQGTSDWSVAGNGTVANASYVTHAVLDNTLVIGDGSGTMKYSTDGTSFTDIAAAPVGGQFPVEYQGRIYAAGTASYIFYSTVGTASDWTSDSSSLFIGGAGKMGALFKASDRLMTTKNSGLLHRWDGEELVDLATKLGPSSPYSIGEVEDFRFWLNRKGLFTSNAGKPQLISNPIQRQIYNSNNTGIAASIFDTAPGGVNGYEYVVAVGTVTDDFTNIQIPNAIIGYDYQHNEFFNYKFANFPTAFHEYKDATGNNVFMFGDANGQVYQFNNSTYSDNGTAIETNMVIALHGNSPHLRKDFGKIEFFTSPGCQAMVQFAVIDVMGNSIKPQRQGAMIWKDLCSLTSGYTLVDFPPETRGRFLYLRFYEAGIAAPWTLYSLHYTFEPIQL